MNLRGGLAAIAIAIGFVLVPSHAAVAASSSEIVSIHDLGTGAGEVWVFEPSHVPDCIVTFVPDAGDLSPERYTAWLSYLALGNDCAVVFPRYETSLHNHSPASDLRGLHSGIARGVAYVHAIPYGAQKLHVAANVPVVSAGFGYGGVLALAYAANAASWSLPAPRAIDSVFPVAQTAAALLPSPIPRSTRVLIQVGDQDQAGGSASGQILARLLAKHPAGHKRLQVVHSTASLPAVHAAPLQITIEAENAFWAPLDSLIAAAKG
jgi:hypothetical protein